MSKTKTIPIDSAFLSFKCDECGKIVKGSVEEILSSGIPFCPECETDEELEMMDGLEIKL